MRTRKDQFDVEWRYAQDLWRALTTGAEWPVRPRYRVFEVAENTGHEKLVKTVEVSEMVVDVDKRIVRFLST